MGLGGNGVHSDLQRRVRETDTSVIEMAGRPEPDAGIRPPGDCERVPTRHLLRRPSLASTCGGSQERAERPANPLRDAGSAQKGARASAEWAIRATAAGIAGSTRSSRRPLGPTDGGSLRSTPGERIDPGDDTDTIARG